MGKAGGVVDHGGFLPSPTSLRQIPPVPLQLILTMEFLFKV
jgi:hypothetical protein